MPISNKQWRVEIGMFNTTDKTRFINETTLRAVGPSSVFRFGFRFVFVVIMLFACGNIILNPGPATISQFAIGI